MPAEVAFAPAPSKLLSPRRTGIDSRQFVYRWRAEQGDGMRESGDFGLDDLAITGPSRFDAQQRRPSAPGQRA
jgi:hypothetical protein